MMQPGPELDAQVAEKVLGRRARVVRDPAFIQERQRAEIWSDARPGAHGQLVGMDGSAGWYPCAPYSTDLTTCAAAADEWRAKSGRNLWWRICSGGRDGSIPSAAVFEGSVCLVEWSGETPAHALALALLEAVGHE